MAGFLRRLFFGLGVMLGVMSPELAPDLAARLFRSRSELLANVEVEGAYTSSALELAAAGNRVALDVELRLKGEGGGENGGFPPLLARRSLRYDAVSGNWVVAMEPEGLEKRTKDRDAALVLATRFWALRIAPLAGLGDGGSVIVSARAGLVDGEGVWHGAAILWGYAEPSRVLPFGKPDELPY